jgi:hypothetical protein
MMAVSYGVGMNVAMQPSLQPSLNVSVALLKGLRLLRLARK